LLRKYVLEREFVNYVDESWADIGRVRRTLEEAGLRIVRQGVLDVPPWPDTVMPASEVLGRLGIRSKKLEGQFSGDSWQWSTMAYYLGQRWVHLAAVGLYTLLALVLTWPLVRYLGTHVPGSDTWAFDEYTFIWNTWWFRYALLDLGQNPLYTTHIFYPLGISLVLYTYNLFNALIALPLQAFLPLPAISNLSFLGATVLSGYGTFLLVEYLLRDLGPPQDTASGPGSTSRYLAPFLAGLLYAFGSFRMVYAAIGHYNMWSTAWIPFYALFLTRTIREPGWRNAAFAGLFLALAMLNEMIFGVFLVMLSLILLAFALSRRAGAGRRAALPAVAAAHPGRDVWRLRVGRLGRRRKAVGGLGGPGHAHGVAPLGWRLGRGPAPDTGGHLPLPRRGRAPPASAT